jgi:hypothetical protein
MSTNELWQCPRCGRQFAKRNQSHSCGAYSIDNQFRGKSPSLRKVFDQLLNKVSQFGPVRSDTVRSAINITNRFHFAMVYVLRDSLKVDFSSNRKLDSKRILRSQKMSENSYINYLKLTSPEDTDEELLGWLKEAYLMAR